MYDWKSFLENSVNTPNGHSGDSRLRAPALELSLALGGTMGWNDEGQGRAGSGRARQGRERCSRAEKGGAEQSKAGWSGAS